MYTPHEDCHSDNHSLASSGEISSTSVSGLNSKTVDLSLNRRSLNASRFCSIVTATDGPTVAKVEGIFNAGIYSQFQHLCEERLLALKPQCSTIKGSIFISTHSSEIVGLLNYNLWDYPSQADCKGTENHCIHITIISAPTTLI